MSKEDSVLGGSIIVQKKDGATVQLTKELQEDVSLYLLFLGMNVEVLANKLKMPVENLLSLLDQNIRVEPMNFRKEEER